MDIRIIEFIVTIVCSVMASSGFWAVVQHYLSKNDADGKLLLGIAHDRIMCLGRDYLRRGSISPEEYENLVTYLYEPYLAKGGNGSVKKIMQEVDKLPIIDRPLPTK